MSRPRLRMRLMSEAAFPSMPFLPQSTTMQPIAASVCTAISASSRRRALMTWNPIRSMAAMIWLTLRPSRSSASNIGAENRKVRRWEKFIVTAVPRASRRPWSRRLGRPVGGSLRQHSRGRIKSGNPALRRRVEQRIAPDAKAAPGAGARFIQLSLRSTHRVPRAIEAPAKLRLAGRRPRQCAIGVRLRRAGGSGGTGAWGQSASQVTSRGDYDRARLVSSALAWLCEYWRREGRAFSDEPAVAKAAE